MMGLVGMELDVTRRDDVDMVVWMEAYAVYHLCVNLCCSEWQKLAIARFLVHRLLRWTSTEALFAYHFWPNLFRVQGRSFLSRYYRARILSRESRNSATPVRFVCRRGWLSRLPLGMCRSSVFVCVCARLFRQCPRRRFIACFGTAEPTSKRCARLGSARRGPTDGGSLAAECPRLGPALSLSFR